jgi:hypothetical protein
MKITPTVSELNLWFQFLNGPVYRFILSLSRLFTFPKIEKRMSKWEELNGGFEIQNQLKHPV